MTPQQRELQQARRAIQVRIDNGGHDWLANLLIHAQKELGANGNGLLERSARKIAFSELQDKALEIYAREQFAIRAMEGN